MFTWFGQRLFQYVHQNHLVYGACWEDPRVDRAALQIGPSDHLLVITSAGCNVLDYLLEEPRQIHAVDLNYRQNAPLDLKLAGIRELDWTGFFAMFGSGRDPGVRERYAACLRRHLQPRHRQFWDRHIGLFCGRKRFYHRTTSGWFASWFRFYVDRVVRLRQPIEEMLDARTVDQQQEIYDRKIRDKFWQPPLAFALQRHWVLALSGIPPDQRRQLRKFQPNLLAYLQARAESVIYHLPLSENYFWRAYLTGHYTPACCPRYLEAENFERLKSLTDRVSLHTSSVTDCVRTSTQKFTQFVLLDHMDWLASSRFSDLEDEWAAMLGAAAPGARFLWRSLGLNTDFVNEAEVLFAGQDRPVGELLDYDRELADEWFKQERANAYGCLNIATLKASPKTT